MKKEFVRTFTKHLGVLMLLLWSFNSYAQQGGNANDHDKPYMWVDQKLVPDLLKNFVAKKLPLIDEATRKVQPRSFMLGNFLGMIDYFKETYKKPKFECLHVYIATFSDEGSNGVPKNCGNLLTLIFAPASEYSSSQSDLGYFIIPPGISFDEDFIDEFKIDKKLFEEWTKNYISEILPKISGTIDEIPANQLGDGTYSDTRCITYCEKDLSELVDEQTYTHTKGTGKVKLKKSITASFAAFGDDGNQDKVGKKRLFLVFDFLDDKGKIIHLEETDGFSGRNPSKGTCRNCSDPRLYEKKGKIIIKGLDNGQLCPPCENCPVGYSDCPAPLQK